MFKKIQDFYSLIAKLLNDVTDLGKKWRIFNIKSDCGLDIFYHLSQSWTKISNNIVFDALLVFLQHQIKKNSPLFTVPDCFCPTTFLIAKQ